MSPKSKSSQSPSRSYRSFKREPRAAGEVLRSTLKYFRLDKKAERYAAFPYWREIVGEKIAEIAFPEKILRNRILVVRVEDAVWAQELCFHKQAILDKLHQLALGAVIEDIRFITGSPRTFKTVTTQ